MIGLFTYLFVTDITDTSSLAITQAQEELVTTFRFGPVFYPQKIVRINPHILPVSERNRLIHDFMALPSAHARAPYKIFDLIGGIDSSLLSSNDETSLPRRRDFFHSFSPQMIVAYKKQLITLFLEKPETMSDSQDDNTYQNLRALMYLSYVNAFFGIEAYTSPRKRFGPLLDFYLEVDNFAKQLSWELLLPTWILQRHPSVRQLQQRCTQALRQFIHHNWTAIRFDIRENGSSKNSLSKAIAKAFPDFDVDGDYTDEQIDAIADHPAVREALLTLFATKNMAHALSGLMQDLAQALIGSDPRREYLCDTILRDVCFDTFTPEQRARASEAFFYAGIARYSTANGLLRYAQSDCTIGATVVPAGSTVLLKLNDDDWKINPDAVFTFHQVNLEYSNKKVDPINTTKMTVPTLVLTATSLYLYKAGERVAQPIELTTVDSWSRLQIKSFINSYGNHRRTLQNLAPPVIQAVLEHCPLTLKGQLRERAYSPFGIGPRSCPAQTTIFAQYKSCEQIMSEALAQHQEREKAMDTPAGEEKVEIPAPLDSASQSAPASFFNRPPSSYEKARTSDVAPRDAAALSQEAPSAQHKYPTSRS